MKWLYLAVGGILGTLARYLIAGSIQTLFGMTFPIGTLAVNILGCLLAGSLVEVGANTSFLTPDMRLLLVVGFCGAFTTFSAWMLETEALRESGAMAQAAGNVFASVLLGYVAFRLGMILTAKIF